MITHALSRNNFPPEIQYYVHNFYTNFQATVHTNSFISEVFSFKRGVFQGDPFSPIIFLMVFNPIGLWLPDYVDGWLPTLDTNMMVDEENLIQYKYYEKPTTTNCTIRQATAMSENCKLQCQSQDLIRRLLNTREELPPKYRASIIDEYGVKLRTSGYAVKVTRKILHNGMKGYITKVTRRRANNGGRIHRTAAESSKDRLRRKFIGRSSWFKGWKTGSKDDKPQGT